jgi:predicted nucleic acid-binding protein
MDALQERQPFDVHAKEILKHAQDGRVNCLFTANAATDIYYLYSKARDIKSARVALSFLLKNYNVVSVTHEDCISAMSVNIEDFEDALVVVCAQKANVDYIVTRDEMFLKAKLSIKTILPKEFVSIL